MVANEVAILWKVAIAINSIRAQEMMVANQVAILLEVAVAHVKKVGRGSLPVRTANISLVTVTNTTEKRHTERFAQQN
jgi:predicted XRE-type DNA-binding protein